MAEHSYTTVPGQIGPLLRKIRDVGVPDRATTRWLPSIGFGSTNHRSLLAVLKQIGFIDESGTPTQTWKSYRGNNSKQILGNAVRQGYADLYKTLPDAHNRSAQELESFFKVSSKAGAQAISKTVNTFRALVAEAEFSASADDAAPAASSSDASQNRPPMNDSSQPEPHTPEGTKKVRHNMPNMHIDIQIHISADATPDQIDQIFSSMAKHLYS